MTRTRHIGASVVISEGDVCEKICGTRVWVSIRVLGYMYVYIREYIYYLVSLVFSSLFREDVHVGRMVEDVGSREARACDLTWSVRGWK